MLKLSVDRWFNTPAGPPDLSGQVVVLYAFQMLCPMCVEEATPLMNRLYGRLNRVQAQVIGLHTVFENHDAMRPDALGGYLRRAGVRFPVGVDEHEATDDAPVTMRRLLLMGTPSIVTVDRRGEVRERLFGVPGEDWLLKRVAQLGAGAA